LALTGDVNAGCAPAFLRNGKERAMIRRRFKQQLPLQDRLKSFATTARELAALFPPGAEKDELLRKAQRAEALAGLNNSFDPKESSAPSGRKIDVFFSCPNCEAVYKAVQELHPVVKAGRFSCKECGIEVFSWRGRYDYSDWRLWFAPSVTSEQRV
jgi:hypothetical protein